MRVLIAAAVLATVLPFATSSTFARGYGPCTPPKGHAVGAAGPAMSGGQLMAGVGQCRRISAGIHPYGYRPPHYHGSYARY
jgi:hypothetical protein